MMTKDLMNDLIKALSDKSYTKIEMAQLTVMLLTVFSNLTWYFKIPILIGLKLFFNWMNKQIPHVVFVLKAKQMVKGLKLGVEQ